MDNTSDRILCRYKDAEECCCSSLELDKYNGKAYLIRARAKNKLGNLEDAVKGQYTIITVGGR